VFSYRSSSKWNNSVWFHTVLSALIWLPCAWFAIAVARDASGFHIYITAASMLLILALALLNKAQTKIRFPAVEVGSEHLVLNLPMNRRTVYNLSDIDAPKCLANILYFRHLGWPVLTSISFLPKDKQAELVQLLNTRAELRGTRSAEWLSACCQQIGKLKWLSCHHLCVLPPERMVLVASCRRSLANGWLDLQTLNYVRSRQS